MESRKRNPRALGGISIVLLIVLFVSVIPFIGMYQARAAAVSWDGGGDGVSWEDAANWSDDVVPDDTDDVTITGATITLAGTDTVNSLSLISSTLTFEYDAITGGALIIDDGNLSVDADSTVTHSASSTFGGGVQGTVYFDVQTGDATIAGTINVNERGYAAGEGPGVGGCDAGDCGGGGYGGEGGDESSSLTLVGGIAYGCSGATCNASNISVDVENPASLGSGGGGSNSGAGGGSITLDVAGTLTVSGSVTSNGGNGTADGGGGSGGSINITAGDLDGAGSITANGGTGDAPGGGGGGGRIAVHYTSLGTFDLDTMTVYGGAQTDGNLRNFGGAGTIVTQQGANDPSLIIDNNDQTAGESDYKIGRTPINYTDTFTDLTLRNAGNLDLDASANITVSGTFTWSDSGELTDNGGTFSPVSGGGALTVPATAILYANTTRSYTDGTIGGTVTHSNNYNTETHKLNQTFSGNLTVSSGGAIDVSGRGYLGGEGPGAGTEISGDAGGGGYGGEGGDESSSVTHTGGIAYGCDGATCNEANISFDVENPHSLGSGGGGTYNGAGSGGGSITVDVTGTLTVTGDIHSDGRTAFAGDDGGGSGGSINITAADIDGAGTISANGGSGDAPGAPGGGGRIALLYTTAGTFDLSSPTAYGGPANANTSQLANLAGAGTVLTKQGGNDPSLVIDNNDQTPGQSDYAIGRTPINYTDTFTDLTLRNAGNLDLDASANITVSGTFTWSDSGELTDNGGTFSPVSGGGALTVPATAILYANTTRSFTDGTISGTLTHSNNYDTAVYDLDYTFSGDVTVSSGGAIDVSSRGFMGEQGPGSNTVCSSGVCGGGGYGGEGGDYTNVFLDYGLSGGSAYGCDGATCNEANISFDVENPHSLGSGGGGIYNTGGYGGGLITLDVTGTLTITGDIRSNGGTAVTANDGGGSGGAINITAATIDGAGAVSANGGDAEVGTRGGGGGGGRIALLYTTTGTFDLSTPTAYGGSGGIDTDYVGDGGAGTILLKEGANDPSLIIDNNDQAPGAVGDLWIGMTPLNYTDTFTDLTVRNAAMLDLDPSANLTVSGTFTWSDSAHIIDNGGTLAPLSSAGSLTIPETSVLYANTTRTFTDVTVNGTLTHSNNGSTEDYKIDYTTSGSGNFTIGATGTVDVQGKGYVTAEGPGAGVDGGTWSSGAGHGGTGGDSADAGGNEGSTYDFSGVCSGVSCDTQSPTTIGSGGGRQAGSSIGGFGGGAVKLTVGGDLAIGGDINADSGNGYVTFNGGGGSGGSVWLNVTGTMSGSGLVSADGGDGEDASSGAGGGGRISLTCGSDAGLSSTFTVDAGSLGLTAEAGSLYDDCSGGQPPTGTFNSAVQQSGGTGSVDLSIEIDDVESDDVRAKIEYETDSDGACDGPWAAATLTGSATADFDDSGGAPDVNNGNAYQIGSTATTRIITSSGSNTVLAVWDADTDLPTANGTQCLRLTANDDVADQTTPATQTLAVDVVAPTVSSATMLDTNNDGTIDRVDVTFSENVSLSAYNTADWSFNVVGDVNLDDTGATVSGTDIRLAVSADANETGGTTAPTLSYTNNAGQLTDAAGNEVLTFGSAESVLDGAGPVILTTSPLHGATDVDISDDVIVTFTEAVNTGTFAYTFSDTPLGLSEAFSSGDSVVTISHTGPFSVGTQTFTVTTAEDGVGNSLAGAVSGVTHPVVFDTAAPISGSSTLTYVSNNSVTINQGDACTPSRTVTLSLKARNAVEVIIGQNSLFQGSSWQPFEATSFDENGVPVMSMTWSIDPGEDAVYAQFRSQTNTVSSLVLDTISVDTENLCVEEIPSVPAEETDDTGVNPITGEEEAISVVEAGDYIKAPSFSDVYYIDDEINRHPVIDARTLLTHGAKASDIKIVTDATMGTLGIGEMFLPKAGSTLLKFLNNPKVFVIEDNTVDFYTPILRHIPNEDVAEDLVGARWQDFIYEISDAHYHEFVLGSPLPITGYLVDLSKLVLLK